MILRRSMAACAAGWAGPIHHLSIEEEVGGVSEVARNIDELSRVHEVIRHYVRDAKKSIDDLAVVSSQCHDQFSPEQCKTIVERQFSLAQSLRYLHEGIEDHRLQESVLLRPLVGEILMKSVDRERNEINKAFETASAELEGIDESPASPTDLPARVRQGAQAMDTFSRLIEIHSSRIDTILEMLRNGMSH